MQVINNVFMLYDREEKYGHTCVVALQNGALSSTGARQVTNSIPFLEY